MTTKNNNDGVAKNKLVELSIDGPFDVDHDAPGRTARHVVRHPLMKPFRQGGLREGALIQFENS